MFIPGISDINFDASAPWNYIKGVGHGVVNTLEGNPDAVKAAYDKAIQQSMTGGAQIRDFLMGREQQAQKFYAPIQQMFSGAYGTQGIKAPQVPSVPGSTPFTSAFGGAR